MVYPDLADVILTSTGSCRILARPTEVQYLRRQLKALQDEIPAERKEAYGLTAAYGIGFNRATEEFWLTRNGRKLHVNALTEQERVLWQGIYRDLQYAQSRP